MAKLKIYGVPASRAMRTYWMANELGLDYEIVPVHFAKSDTKSATFRSVNPNGRIPAIDDDGVFLFESMAINLYLAKKHGGPLQPAAMNDEGRALQWSFWVVTEVEKLLLQAYFHRALLPEPQRNEALAKEAEAQLEGPLGVLNAALADRHYLLGDIFSVADLNVGSVLTWLNGARIDIANKPHLAAWIARWATRPALQKTIAMRMS